METVWFKGEVIPKRSRLLNISGASVKCKSDLDGTEFLLTIQIVESEISIKCNIESYVPDKFNEIYIQAYKLSNAIVDLSGFISGSGWRVNLDKFVDISEAEQNIQFHEPELEAISSSATFAELETLIPLLLSDGRFMVALNDLMQTVVAADLVVVNSARAVEGIKNLLAPNLEPKASWKLMRDSLNLSADYLRLITDTSKAPRHGNWGYVPSETNKEIVRRAWTVMNRYVAYRKGGDAPLSSPLYPVL